MRAVRAAAAASAALALAVVAAGCGGGGGSTDTAATPTTPASTGSAGGGTAGCSGTVSLGMMAPITGPAASIGGDQLHWAQFFVSEWNASHTPKLKIVQGDTQLDPSKASTVAQQFASNNSIVGIIGPAGSQEVTAVTPILTKAGFAFISGSATNPTLTSGKARGYFFRVVPTDAEQGPTAVDFMMRKLGVGKGSKVMVVDDQESYSTGLADIVQKTLKQKGVNVQRESVSQKSTDFSSLVGRISSDTKVVYLPFQLASQAQLFAQQLKAAGKQAVPFGSDGTFDSAKFNSDGAYISFFAPDVTTLAGAKKTVADFHKQFPGATSPFGAPNYVAANVFAQAITDVCDNGGDLTRDAVRQAIGDVDLQNTILGQPISFESTGEISGAKFHVFKIENGKYVTVE
jgi:branched-chain amino acid transport system substrate-binding protein